MDKELRLLYFVLLAGDCKIYPSHGEYAMDYKISGQDKITCGRIKFDLQGKFQITEGLGAFMWFLSKYFT